MDFVRVVVVCGPKGKTRCYLDASELLKLANEEVRNGTSRKITGHFLETERPDNSDAVTESSSAACFG
jgi:hypothetical protein